MERGTGTPGSPSPQVERGPGGEVAVRLALLADVHANLEALSAMLAEVDQRGCDRLACAGDLVGYGPSPNECVRELLARGAVCVLGNHDLMVLERMTMERCVPDGRWAARWTRRILATDV